MENEIEIYEAPKSLWTKKQNDLTVSDSLKVAGLSAGIAVVAPIAIMGVVAGASVLWDKFQSRKAKKTHLEVVETEK